MVFAIITAALTAYLLGSLNFAVIVSRVFLKDDVRKHGSGNAGMTNILRTYGKGPAVVTAVGDFTKGILAIWLARWLFARAGIVEIDAGYIAGLFVILGHVYPLFFKFRGGKGVITTLSVMFLVNPVVFLIILVVFVPLVFITKIVSISSVLGAIVYPILTFAESYYNGEPALWYSTGFSVLYAAMVLWGHRGNIRRLLKGKEPKFGSKKNRSE